MSPKSAMGKSTEQQLRRRTKQERREIVEESPEPGVSVAGLARAHAVNANQIFHWRKLYREGLLEDAAQKAAAEWLPVRLAEGSPKQPPPARARPAEAAGAIEVEMARGRVRVEGAAEAATLRLVLELLRA